MAKNTSMSLDEHFDQFIANQLEKGGYGSATEVVRAGLRSLETEEEKLDALRRLIDEGHKSGTADYSYESFMAELDMAKPCASRRGVLSVRASLRAA